MASKQRDGNYVGLLTMVAPPAADGSSAPPSGAASSSSNDQAATTSSAHGAPKEYRGVLDPSGALHLYLELSLLDGCSPRSSGIPADVAIDVSQYKIEIPEKHVVAAAGLLDERAAFCLVHPLAGSFLFAAESAILRRAWMKKLRKFAVEEDLSDHKPQLPNPNQRTRLSVIHPAETPDDAFTSDGDQARSSQSSSAFPSSGSLVGPVNNNSAGGILHVDNGTSSTFTADGSREMQKSSDTTQLLDVKAGGAPGAAKKSGSCSSSSSSSSCSSSSSSFSEEDQFFSRADGGRRKTMGRSVDPLAHRRMSVEMLLASPSSRQKRRESYLEFASREQTVIVLDWDDTLYPTTWVRGDVGLSYKYPLEWQVEEGPRCEQLKAKLRHLEQEAILLLRNLVVQGRVLLVTLAKAPWVEMSSKHLTPRLHKCVFEELQIPMLYASEYGKMVPVENNSSPEERYVCMKALAIADGVGQLYLQYPGQTWKNVISIGDSDFERIGTQTAINDYYERYVNSSSTAGVVPLTATITSSVSDVASSVEQVDGNNFAACPSGSTTSGTATGAAGVVPDSSCSLPNLLSTSSPTSSSADNNNSKIDMNNSSLLNTASSEEKQGLVGGAAGMKQDGREQEGSGLVVDHSQGAARTASSLTTQEELLPESGGHSPTAAVDLGNTAHLNQEAAARVAAGNANSPLKIWMQSGRYEGINAHSGHFLRVRCKTVKLLPEPTIEELLAELTLLRLWSQALVTSENGVDVELTTSEADSEIHAIHELLTRSDPPPDLSWLVLSGLT
ncbi:unnamed protein product [Amoebophrya sp. A120]|nr:unnamed protein product [Amoebophrya sp. A120]|eukprot:GSA120T00002541001.1